jgi:hypothetical protein
VSLCVIGDVNKNSGGLAQVAFHIRHIARSVDRLLTYAEGRELSSAQMDALKTEPDPTASHIELFSELADALAQGAVRVRAFTPKQLEESRTVGRKRLPTTIPAPLFKVFFREFERVQHRSLQGCNIGERCAKPGFWQMSVGHVPILTSNYALMRIPKNER